MTPDLPRHLRIEDLATGIPVIDPEVVRFYKLNCMVCFHSQGHTSSVAVNVVHRGGTDKFTVTWDGEVTEQILRSYCDEKKTTDFGACAIALLLIRELTEFTAIEQSNVGTTIDYYLINKEQTPPDDTLIFNGAVAYLEVSGIRQENEGNTVEGRIKDKKRRLNTPEDLPTIISVIEFSKPWAKMAQV